CIATIRDPRDAVISCLIREPYVSLSAGLSIYARFYEIVARHEQKMVVAHFDKITSDFPAVIASTNDRFGTTFASYDQNDEQVSWCFHLIDLRVRGGELARVINAYMSG